MNKKGYRRQYYLKNKERTSELGKIWYQNNKKRKLESGRKWQKNNRKRMVEIVQKYVQNNKEKVANYNKEFSQTIEGKYRLIKYRHNKKKWLDKIMTLEEFIEIAKNPCAYCGGDTQKGIDRVDNNKGYTKENSVVCCNWCNRMKWILSKEEFINHIIKIYQHQI